WHLKRADCLELCLAHTGSAQDAATLNPERRRDHGDRPDAAKTAFFEEQGNVENDNVARAVTREKALLRARDRWMNDRLKRGEFVAVSQYARAELLPIDALCPGGAGKARLDRANERAARSLQPMDLGIGVKDGHAFALEH